MIGPVLAGVLACVPLTQADAYGDIRFDEGARPDDPRLVEVVCTDGHDGECDGRDAKGVRYGFLDGKLLLKVVDGAGPSARFRDQLEPSPYRSNELWVGLCDFEASWVALRTDADGKQVYGIYAQP